MSCILVEHSQTHQVLAVDVNQGIEIDEFLAKEEFQEFSEKKTLI